MIVLVKMWNLLRILLLVAFDVRKARKVPALGRAKGAARAVVDRFRPARGSLGRASSTDGRVTTPVPG